MEDYYYESPPTSPRNAGTDPSTTNMQQWYQKHNRVSDQKVPTGTNRASYHARETIKDDDERLAMRKGDLPPPVRERVANPRIREDRAVQGIPTELGKDAPCRSRRRPTQKAWFDSCRSVFPQSVRKAGPDVDLNNVSTYQCSILFNNVGSFSRKSEFRKAEIIDKPISANERFNVTNDPHLSLLPEFW